MTRLVQDLVAVVITAVISILATLAIAADGLPRDEVEKMIRASEVRSEASIQELKSQQWEILTRVQQIQIELAKLSSK